MKTYRTNTELGIWASLALVGGFLPAWIDLSATEVQGPAAVLMLVNFALTLPGRAPVWLVAVCSWLAMPISYAIKHHDVNPGMIIALIPALIGAGGGRLAGALLDTAASQLADARSDGDRSWLERPLSTRFLLAITLTVIAAAGWPAAAAGLHSVGHKAPDWLALVWQIMTLLGWIALTPMILTQRPLLRRSQGAVAGIRPLELLGHLLIVCMLAVVHAAAIVTLCGLLFIPLSPGWVELTRTAFEIYLPLDLLAYLAILALGFASDVERHGRDAAQREAALNAETLDSRMSALRAGSIRISSSTR